ncbi:hypothetical protein K438DRAFT_1829381 [Mycena galopus ATCC 62051]|nr:hypothetical protein K438DRAFT_1829381 [Mycena galopus ATCC 62051]
MLSSSESKPVTLMRIFPAQVGKCTLNMLKGYLRQYFRNGTSPAAGTVCTPDNPLFPSSNAQNSTNTTGRELDARSELVRAGRAISEAYRRVAAAAVL